MRERRLEPGSIPRHVAIIMDGNGRWAEQRGLSRVEGHRQGLESVRAVIRAAHELGIRYVTLYAFSLENWSRPRGEVDELMRLLEHYMQSELAEVMRNGVRVHAIGRLERLPDGVRRSVDDAIERTQDNREMDLCFALSYGGRAEIVDAARALAGAALRGEIDPETIEEKDFAARLYAPALPDPDLLIRTGGESRVSNFLLWQIAYAELYMSPVYWPDFRKGHLVEALIEYQSRERRFGLTSAQVRS